MPKDVTDAQKNAPGEAPWAFDSELDIWVAKDAKGQWVNPNAVDPATLIQDKLYGGVYPRNFDRISAGGGRLVIVHRKNPTNSPQNVVVMQHNLASLSDVEREEYKRQFGFYPGES